MSSIWKRISVSSWVLRLTSSLATSSQQSRQKRLAKKLRKATIRLELLLEAQDRQLLRISQLEQELLLQQQAQQELEESRSFRRTGELKELPPPPNPEMDRMLGL